MTHLSSREIVDAADGALEAPRLRHADTCAECARAVEDVRRASRALAEAGDVPEPSPLFWDHLSARVRAATADAPVPARTGWWMPLWKPALAAALMVLAVVFGLQRFTSDGADQPASVVARDDGRAAESATPPEVADATPRARDEGSEPPAGTSAPPVEELGLTAPEPESDDWSAVTAMAGRLDAAEVDALVPAADAGPLLAEELNARELQEFARLLRAEMGGME